jgi:hypothetical protein
MAPSILDRVLRRAQASPANDVEGPLPTFLTIGTMKGGTSALHSYLAEHPHVGMSKPKETDFFSRPDHDGHDLTWYRSRFGGAGPQFGESSTNYTKRHLFDGVVERMKPVLPDVKLIFLARDPIERAVSNYLHNVAKGRLRLDDFSTFFDDLDNPAVLTSAYAYQLDPFVEAYGLESILVVASEDLRDDRAATLKRVFTFLGVDPEFTSPRFTIDRHVTSTKMEQAGESLDRPALTQRQHDAIADHLRPDIERFRALVGQDFAHWSI